MESSRNQRARHSYSLRKIGCSASAGAFLSYAQESLVYWAILQMGQTESLNQTFLRQVRECCQKSDLDYRAGLRSDCHRQEGTQVRRLALHSDTDSIGLPLLENAHLPGSFSLGPGTAIRRHPNR